MSRSLFDPPRVLIPGLPAVLWLALAWPAPVLAQEEGPAVTETPAAEDSAQSDEGGSRKGKLRISIADDDDDVVSIDMDRHSLKSADYVRFGENIHIPAHERVSGDVVALGGSISVEGEVMGDVVAIGGSVTIKEGAEVGGEVVSLGGLLTLEDSTKVGSDVVSVWGKLKTAPTAEVAGELNDVGGFGAKFPENVAIFDEDESAGSRFLGFLGRVVWVLLLFGLAILAYSVFPARMERLADTIQRRGLVTFLAGMAGWILWLPAFVLLCITIVGIPVAFLLAVFTPIMALVGYLAVAEIVGRRVGARLIPGDGSHAKLLLIGVVTLESGVLFGKALSVVGSFLHFLGVFLSVLGWSLIFVAVTMGFGAFLMTRFRNAPPDAPAMTSPAPPMAPRSPSSWTPPVSPSTPAPAPPAAPTSPVTPPPYSTDS